MNLALFLTDSRKLIWILGGAIGLMMFVAFIFILRGSGGSSTTPAALTVWGVFDTSDAFKEAIGAFEKANPGITVTYRNFTYPEYEAAVLNALAAGAGPDVFMIHNTWLPKHIKKLRPLPAQFPGMSTQLMTLPQFRTTFVDVAENDLVANGAIYGMPLYVDTLALFYNRDLLSSAGIANPPKTWQEFQADVQAITTYDESGNITRSGAAMGTSPKNINRATDILMMLMLQSGVQMTNSDLSAATFSRSVDGAPVGELALQMYTDFANSKKRELKIYSWNAQMNYNIDAFAAGTTAMIINYSHQIDAIRKINPRLNFAVAAVPQPTASDSRTFANYWALTVALQSKHPYEAWRFVHYMTAGDGNIPYLNSTLRPAARRDLIEQQKSDPDLNVFALQALTARSWFQIDNAAIETIFSDMIDAVNLSGVSVKDALKEAEAKVTVLMSAPR